MTGTIQLALSLLLLAASLTAQTTAASVTATGTAAIYVQPDQVQLTVSITTQGTTATAAGQQNANVTVAVTKAVTSVLGSSGSIQTVSYSVYPQYGAGAQSSTIVGYSATNSFQVTMTDLTLIGNIIDAANQAGATGVGNLTLGLQNPAPSLQQALTAASKLGLANAGAIASGLGRTTGSVISAQQSSAVIPLVALVSPVASTTPVQTGPVSVSATVSVTVQLQ
jgi:uncharacterized protein YggE